MSAGLLTTIRTGDRLSQRESYLHVIHALMLRDMRTRFGGSLWGYCIDPDEGVSPVWKN